MISCNESQKFVSLQCVFHSIRFKVNKVGRSGAHFFCSFFQGDREEFFMLKTVLMPPLGQVSQPFSYFRYSASGDCMMRRPRATLWALSRAPAFEAWVWSFLK